MTTFLYRCERDGIVEVRHSRTADRTRQLCPKCCGPIEPRWAAAPVVLRGDGWTRQPRR